MNTRIKIRELAAITAVILAMVMLPATAADTGKDKAPDDSLLVVTTLPDYAWVAREIGGEHIDVHSIAKGNQDAHFVRPRPSYSVLMRDADLFVSTGLDLELWVPTLLDSAGNGRILEGQPGYVAAWPGIELLEVPATLSRSEGGVHVYGNPHIHTDPLNMVSVARNILAGLKKIDPSNTEIYEEREMALEDRLHRRLFGDQLVDLLGGETLARLAASGKLWTFLEEREYPRGSGRALLDRLGGWLGQAEPLRGAKIIGYHKNWIYFGERFGLDFVGYIEPKPSIPPTPRHVETMINLIRDQGIKVILSANYFDPAKPQVIADRTGAMVVIVPLGSGGEPGLDSYEDLIDAWITRLVAAFEIAGAKNESRHDRTTETHHERAKHHPKGEHH